MKKAISIILSLSLAPALSISVLPAYVQPIRPEIPWQAIINAQARGLTSLKRKITA